MPSIGLVEVQGLAGCDFIDKTRAGAHLRQDETLLRITAETDRVYVNTPSQISVRSDGRVLVAIHKDATLPEAVVWNVWSEKIKSMADMAANEYEKYLCVEAAVVAVPVSVAPGARWQGGQTFVSGNSSSL